MPRRSDTITSKPIHPPENPVLDPAPDFSPLEERASEPPEHRRRFRHFLEIPTRWEDNDIYGHVNNVVYYSFFDTAANCYLIREGGLDIERSPVIGVVVESKCIYRRSIAYPETLDAGLRANRVGNTSVTYGIGIFRKGEDEAAAWGHFVHVFVDRETRRSVPIPEGIRAALEKIRGP